MDLLPTRLFWFLLKVNLLIHSGEKLLAQSVKQEVLLHITYLFD